MGLAKQDKPMQGSALTSLVQNTQDFGVFLSADPNLPQSVVADLVKTHVLTLKEVLDARAVNAFASSFTSLCSAAGHMRKRIVGASAEAIVKQFPQQFAN